MPVYGAAYAASNTGTTTLYWFKSPFTVLIPTTKIVNFMGFSRSKSNCPV